MEVSVVVPAYNEEARLSSTLPRLFDFLSQRWDAFELLVVDDGSRDGTAGIVTGFTDPRVRLLRNETNQGKGQSVRRGMLAARFDPVLFTDADLSTPIDELPKLAAALRNASAGVAIASRAAPGAVLKVRQPLRREALGRLFNLAVQALALPGLRDTQCGFKLFSRGAARRIFPLMTIRGFGFDAEVLFIARRLGIPIVEVPVTWLDSPQSRVRPFSDGLRMTLDLIRIRHNELRGAYAPHETENEPVPGIH